jgi:GTP-binding protein
LIDFRYTQHFRAQRGMPGAGTNRTGAGGEDLVIKVPIGTQVIAEDKETVLADFTVAGEQRVFLRGGDGGRGNATYKTSTNRAPRQHGPGWPSEEMWVWLRLKLLADVGLVGLPNAGKSTFINAVTNAAAKVGAYPFTTIRPQLGVASRHGREFVIADIPGLIEGAADGAGIGDRFLGHIERCQVILHLVDASGDDPVEAWRIVRGELDAYGGGLVDKPEILALNKIDAVDPKEVTKIARKLAKASGETVLLLSGAAGTGVDEALDHFLEILGPAKPKAEEPEEWSPL